MKLAGITADNIAGALLSLPSGRGVCLLDSCGIGHHGSRYLIAGVDPVEVISIGADESQPLESIQDYIDKDALASIFTLSYELGHRILPGLAPQRKRGVPAREPLAFIARFDALIVHDHVSGETWLAGNPAAFGRITDLLGTGFPAEARPPSKKTFASSNFTRDEYIAAVEEIREEIRSGNTYQANLTQQITVDLSGEMSAADVFLRLRRDHPAPFAAFIERGDSTVVSASPERLVRIENGAISASPVKGTITRGADRAEDETLRRRLAESEKDRAENTMIVDLLRNDLGRICEYGSVRVTNLCTIEEHPTLFHMVSTIKGRLRPEVGLGDVLTAVFPCGSITGAPKISTMNIIDRIETLPRGLSMGSIGISIPDGFTGIAPFADLNVAIRTMVVTGRKAVFNVGGGIVIDSDPAKEYEESLLKARALLTALGAELK